MKKYILLFCSAIYLFFGGILYAQTTGCGDPVSSNYLCNINWGACSMDMSSGFPVFYLPGDFVDDGSCIYATNTVYDVVFI